MQEIDVVNPATEEVIGVVRRETEADADGAVRAARDAFRKWRWVPAVEKAVSLHSIAAGMRQKQNEHATFPLKR